MQIPATERCLANIEVFRGAPPAVRIGGTTQDRATYDPALMTAVDYTVPNPSAAPDFLSYGPSFFDLAGALRGDVTVGLNRQLNNITNTQLAALQATRAMRNLLSVEVGNEPEFYNSSSKIIPAGQSWNPNTDSASQKQWFTTLTASVGNIFQAAVYLQAPTWSTAGLIPRLGDAIQYVKTFSGHSYPQSACGGASTNLANLMSHSGIVSWMRQYNSEAAAAHAQGKRYFLGETNSATCGGGGISPTFGAGLWVLDYVLQGALNNVDRLYFHQGTIGNSPYSFWDDQSVNAPYYGAVFVSEFLGSGFGTRLVMLDNGSDTLGAYAVFSSGSSTPQRVLFYNSEYFAGSGTRNNATIVLTVPSNVAVPSQQLRLKRLSAPSATALASTASVAIGEYGRFSTGCVPIGKQILENVAVGSGATVNVAVRASEAAILYFP